MSPDTLFQALGTTAILLLVWAAVAAVRRLYFHPLAHVPGPRLAAVTWWYEFYYDCIRPGQYVFKIQELHKRYGPIIRITPEELHVNDVGFLDTVYAPAAARRDKYDYQLRSLRMPGSIGTTARSDVHRRHREALGAFFSRRNVVYLEPLIREKADQLCGVLSRHAAQKSPVNLSDVLFAYTNDVATNFLFAHKADVLSDEAKAAAIRRNTYELIQGVHSNKHFPWIPDFLEALPMFISKPMMPPGLIDLLNLFATVRTELISVMETKESGASGEKRLGPTGKESVFDSVLDSSALLPHEKSLASLEQEGALLVLAGTESPAKTLSVILYHLAKNPPILQALREELGALSSKTTMKTAVTPAWAELERLPYLSAVIEEGNRLAFGVTARLARIAYEPLVYTPSPHVSGLLAPSTMSRTVIIPASTPVSITSLSAHTAPSVFADPYVFDPTRWLGEVGRERRRFQHAFGRGARKCLGVELASAELYLVTAALVTSFDLDLYQTDDSDVAFTHDYHVALPKPDSKGVRVTVETR